jgi:microsomal epoxide hydrolase
MAKIKDDDGTEFNVHFMALFSTRSDAIPISFFHGWPGSFLEFQKIFKELKTKYNNDPAQLPYHCIAPSLIGFGLSDKPPKNKNWNMTDLARIMNKLMLALGFSGGYIAQGGDIGSSVSQRLAQDYAECRAIHCKCTLLYNSSRGELTL